MAVNNAFCLAIVLENNCFKVVWLVDCGVDKMTPIGKRWPDSTAWLDLTRGSV
jgi:hypothetical protein